jgi:hypothetical protein
MEYSMCELAYRSVHRVEGVVKKTHTHKPLCGYQRRAQVVRNHQLSAAATAPVRSLVFVRWHGVRLIAGFWFDPPEVRCCGSAAAFASSALALASVHHPLCRL